MLRERVAGVCVCWFTAAPDINSEVRARRSAANFGPPEPCSTLSQIDSDERSFSVIACVR